MWFIVKYNVLYQYVISPSLPLPIVKYYSFFIFIAKSNAFLFTSPAIAHSRRFSTSGKSIFSLSLDLGPKTQSKDQQKRGLVAFWYVGLPSWYPGTNENLSHLNRGQWSNVIELIKLSDHHGKVIVSNYWQCVPKVELNTKKLNETTPLKGGQFLFFVPKSINWKKVTCPTWSTV